jgi:hypothetical protein
MPSFSRILHQASDAKQNLLLHLTGDHLAIVRQHLKGWDAVSILDRHDTNCAPVERPGRHSPACNGPGRHAGCLHSQFMSAGDTGSWVVWDVRASDFPNPCPNCTTQHHQCHCSTDSEHIHCTGSCNVDPDKSNECKAVAIHFHQKGSMGNTQGGLALEGGLSGAQVRPK